MARIEWYLVPAWRKYSKYTSIPLDLTTRALLDQTNEIRETAVINWFPGQKSYCMSAEFCYGYKDQFLIVTCHEEGWYERPGYTTETLDLVHIITLAKKRIRVATEDASNGDAAVATAVQHINLFKSGLHMARDLDRRAADAGVRPYVFPGPMTRAWGEDCLPISGQRESPNSTNDTPSIAGDYLERAIEEYMRVTFR